MIFAIPWRVQDYQLSRMKTIQVLLLYCDHCLSRSVNRPTYGQPAVFHISFIKEYIASADDLALASALFNSSAWI